MRPGDDGTNTLDLEIPGRLFSRQSPEGEYVLDLYRIDVSAPDGRWGMLDRSYLITEDDLDKFTALYGFDASQSSLTITRHRRSVQALGVGPGDNDAAHADVRIHVIRTPEHPSMVSYDD